MASKNNHIDDGAEPFGLVANGSAGSWDVDVDEALRGEQRWFLQIDGPVMYLYCEVEHPRIVDEIICFLTAHARNNGEISVQPSCDGELEVSGIGKNRVTLLWDPGANDRCAIMVSGPAELCTRFILERRDLQDLIDALRQVHDELTNAGLVQATLAKPSK